MPKTDILNVLEEGTDSFAIPPCGSAHDAFSSEEGRDGGQTGEAVSQQAACCSAHDTKVTPETNAAQCAGHAGAQGPYPGPVPRFSTSPSRTSPAALEVHLSRRFTIASVLGCSSGATRFLNTRGSLVSILAFHRINYWRGYLGDRNWSGMAAREATMPPPSRQIWRRFGGEAIWRRIDRFGGDSQW